MPKKTLFICAWSLWCLSPRHWDNIQFAAQSSAISYQVEPVWSEVARQLQLAQSHMAVKTFSPPPTTHFLLTNLTKFPKYGGKSLLNAAIVWKCFWVIVVLFFCICRQNVPVLQSADSDQTRTLFLPAFQMIHTFNTLYSENLKLQR